MENSTMNFTSEASTNSTNDVMWVLTPLELSMYSINFLFGFPTHSYVLWLIVTGSSGAASEFFNLNLLACEIIACLNSLLAMISYYTKLTHLARLFTFLLGLLVTGRPLLQCLMCVERYLAVVHPVTFLKYKPLRYRLICCAAVWIIILCSCLFCLLTVAQSKYHIYIYFYSIQYLLFLSVQLFCLVAVLRALKQSGPGDRKREKEENHMKRRAFQIILITTVTMCVIYMPFIISAFSFILTQVIIQGLFSFGYISFVLGGLVQPLLYLHRAGKLSCPCLPLV